MKTIVPIRCRTEADWSDIITILKITSTPVDMLEVWLDQVFIRDKISYLRKEFQLPLLGVCKQTSEGGKFTGSLQEKTAILQQFLDRDGQFVDCSCTEGEVLYPAEKLWLSYHDFVGQANLWEDQLTTMLKSPAQVYKLAVTINDKSLLPIIIKLAKKYCLINSLIITTMGQYGQIGRKQLLPYSYGQFVAPASQYRTASGQNILQIPADVLKK